MTQRDAHQHRRELFGDVREIDVPGPNEGADPPDGSRPARVTDEEADRIYRTFWTGDRSQQELARDVGRHQSTVCEIVNRAPRFREATAEAARELGYPEQGPRRKRQGGAP